MSQGGFSKILRTTKRTKANVSGKTADIRRTRKFISLVFRAVSLAVVNKGYILTDMDATLYSVQSFRPYCRG